MSARIANRRKAVDLAWEREQQLVLDGKGTRDWTPQQQQDIIDYGVAYDDNGRAIEGHHMKSVSLFPEYQEDPNNIQFLSKKEHLAAHKTWKNATNGFYDVNTGLTKDFGAAPPEPCIVITLSEPIVLYQVNDSEISVSSQSDCSEARKNNTGTPKKFEQATSEESHTIEPDSAPTKAKKRNSANFRIWASKKAKGAMITLNNIKTKHPILYEMGKDLLCTMIEIGASNLYEGITTKQSNSINKTETPASEKTVSETGKENRERHTETIQETINEQHPIESHIERATPREHTVSAHRQRYHGEWKDVQPYKRGNPKDE